MFPSSALIIMCLVTINVIEVAGLQGELQSKRCCNDDANKSMPLTTRETESRLVRQIKSYKVPVGGYS